MCCRKGNRRAGFGCESESENVFEMLTKEERKKQSTSKHKKKKKSSLTKSIKFHHSKLPLPSPSLAYLT
jgi:hypothetical protein